jgi:antitoxin ParD1/3/4
MINSYKGDYMTKTTQLKRTISLTSEHSNYIEDQVSNNKYASASEVVRAGLRALQERDEVIAEWIRNEVIPAYENYKANPESAKPASEVMNMLRVKIDNRVT